MYNVNISCFHALFCSPEAYIISPVLHLYRNYWIFFVMITHREIYAIYQIMLSTADSTNFYCKRKTRYSQLLQNWKKDTCYLPLPFKCNGGKPCYLLKMTFLSNITLALLSTGQLTIYPFQYFGKDLPKVFNFDFATGSCYLLLKKILFV